MSRDTLLEKKADFEHNAAIKELASGKDMWDQALPAATEDVSDLVALRDNWAKPYVLTVFSTTHRTEKTVGDIKNTATINCTESTRSCIAIARQWQMSRVNQELTRNRHKKKKNMHSVKRYLQTTATFKKLTIMRMRMRMRMKRKRKRIAMVTMMSGLTWLLRMDLSLMQKRLLIVEISVRWFPLM